MIDLYCPLLPSPLKTGWRNIPREGCTACFYVMAETPEGRKAWIKRLTKIGFNFFVTYRDTRSDYALQVSVHHMQSPNGLIFPIVQ